MTRREIVEKMYDACIEQAKVFGLDEALVCYGGEKTNFLYPIRIPVSDLERKKEQFLVDENCLKIKLTHHDDPDGNKGFLAFDAVCQEPTSGLSEVQVFQFIEENGAHDTEMSLSYSDEKRIDGKIVYTGDYVRERCYYCGYGNNCLERFEGFLYQAINKDNSGKDVLDRIEEFDIDR